MKTRQSFVKILALTFVVALTAHAKVDPKAATASGMREFGFKLFQALHASDVKENIAVSPLSITEALVLTMQGADGDTKLALEELLVGKSGTKSGIDRAVLLAGIKGLRADLQNFANKSKESFVFSSASALWANTNEDIGFKFKPGFLQLAEKEFGAKLNAEDFAKPAAVKNINDWVLGKTNKRIDKLVEQLGEDDVAVLLNAVYAKGKFSRPFLDVSEGPYRDAKGNPSTVSYLTKSDSIGFAEDKEVRLFSFNAEQAPDERGAMRNQIAVDILSSQDGKLDTLVHALNGDRYKKLVDGIALKNIKLTIAAGKVEQAQALKLKPRLTAKPFAMTLPFSPAAARFTSMGDTKNKENLYISDILTKMFYEVTPFGFEAAAATAVMMARETAVAEPPKYTPYSVETASVHVIRHIPTGAPLFITVYDSPKLYKQEELITFAEEGAKTGQWLSATTKEGVVRAVYDDASKDYVVALTDASGKVLKTLKALKVLKP